MYKFSIWQFTDKEIDQIVEMVRFSSLGNPNEFIDIHGAIDRRKISKNVFAWARNHNLVTQGKDITDYKGKRPYWVKSKTRWYIYTLFSTFDPFYSAPVEAIWRMIEPIFKESSGFYSIISNKIWLDLGVWYRGTREWDEKNEARVKWYDDHRTFGESTYLPKMYEYLHLLTRNGYIIFQSAGSIWRVEITNRR